MKKIALATASLAGLLALAACNDTTQPHAGPSDMPEGHGSAMAMPAVPADATPATRDYAAAMSKMQGGMAMQYTNNADRDFLMSMIPHHQGAIDMAKVELEHGRDPKVRALAQEVIEAQEREIGQMREWLAEPAATVPAN